jgi:hypothetical protein
MKILFITLSLIFSTFAVVGQHSLGEWFGGGTIFYLYDNAKHGLIAAREDQATSAKWFIGANGPSVTGAFRNGIGCFANTETIIAKQGWGDHAAMLCAKYSGDGFGDWYLPSKAELNLMYQNKNVIINLSMWYWSSTENGWDSAWGQNMTTGLQFKGEKTAAYHVRAIRAF